MTRQSLSNSGGLCALLLSLASVTVSAADGDAPLQQSLSAGMRVRILAPGVFPSKVIGTVAKVSDDAVTVSIPGRSEPVSILREKIARLDVSDGPRARGVGSAIGAGIGAGVGAAGCAAGKGSGTGHLVSTGAAAGVCALFGGGLGALIGAAIPPGEHWKPASESRYQISFTPRLDHGANFLVAWKY
jgi:hypothetical protein